MNVRNFLRVCALLGVSTLLTLVYGGTDSSRSPGSAMFQVFQTSSCQAQVRQIPDARYFGSFYDFYQADYRSAEKQFSRATVFKAGGDRFLDSICVWTMAGECYYHVGNYDAALEMYDNSLRLYLEMVRLDWQARVTIPPLINASNTAVRKANITWGQSARGAQIASLPDSFSFTMGNPRAGNVLNEGGVAAPLEARPVNLAEIMRCTGLALHRRRQILGITSKLDPLTTDIVTGLSRYGAGNGTLMGAWNGVLLGIAYAGAEDYNRAAATLKGALQFNGQMDHQLTPVALLELAQIGLKTGDTKGAEVLALEASYSAAVFYQYDLVEEALTLGKTIHLLQEKSLYPPLPPAARWAGRHKARLLQTSMMVQVAECLAEAGNAADAAVVLAEAHRAAGRNSLPDCVINARRLYVSAVVRFLQGKSELGIEELTEALQRFQGGSRWLYQLARADALVLSGNVSGREADLLYGTLLHDPTPTEWLTDPIEAISFLNSNHVPVMERWFEIKIANRQFDQALDVAELTRRHRFYSALPFAGRLMAFRWVLHGPEGSLTDTAKKQRRDFLTSNPDYKQLVDRVDGYRTRLMAMELLPVKSEPEYKTQLDLFVNFSNDSKLQEAFLASYALRRQVAEPVFPPQRDISAYRSEIKTHQVALITMATASGYHQFVYGTEIEAYLGLVTHRDFKRALSGLYKSLGIDSHSGKLDVEDLSDESWKAAAVEMSKVLLIDQVEPGHYEQLVIIPDGEMWYVPFEVLQKDTTPAAPDPAKAGAAPAAIPPPGANPQAGATPPPAGVPPAQPAVPAGPNYASLLGSFEIRYCPSLYLAFGVQRPERRLTRAAAVVARLHSKGDAESSKAAFLELEKALSGTVAIEQKMTVPLNYFGSILDLLVVWGDTRLPKSGPFSLYPALADEGVAGGNIAAIMSLPFEGPEHVVLPAYWTSGTGSTKATGDGSDLFFLSCGMFASGTRSIMISRWRPGGDNSLQLSRRYAARLTDTTPARALRKSVEEAQALEVQPDLEPRIEKLAVPVKATHPFFWAGNIVIEVPNAQSNVAEVKAVAGDVANPAGVPVVPGAVAPAMPGVVPGAAVPGSVPTEVPGDVPATPADSTDVVEEPKPDNPAPLLPDAVAPSLPSDMPDGTTGDGDTLDDEILEEGGIVDAPDGTESDEPVAEDDGT